MHSVLFIDPVSNKPYCGETLRTQPLGGTEATVVRIAEALASHPHTDVTVMQYARRENVLNEKVAYVALSERFDQTPGDVVLLRAPVYYAQLRALYPKARFHLWLHDLAGAHLRYDLRGFTSIVCVSDFHRTETLEALKALGVPFNLGGVTRIYNPVDDALRADETPIDRNKLVWFSSPHKGLRHALNIFSGALALNPELRLYVSNPGYYESLDTAMERSVVNLGALPHHEAIAHVRNSLCVFYPNGSYPETFGLVMAEANAVGTPVLAHPIGAAREVLNPDSQVLGDRSHKGVISRLFTWRDSRPEVSGKGVFVTSVVANQWRFLLRCK